MRLEGIHHITAIIGDARANVAFYTGVLGLRLVAKTVNQDDPGVYHLFYADERGCAGSELTFFAYQGAVPGRPGAGMVHRIVWRVGSEASLRFWERRVGEAVDAARTDGGVRFADPERLEHELVVGDGRDEPLIAEHPEIPAEHALQGFAGVRAYSDDPGRSGLMLEEVLGARPVADCEWELRGDRRGSTIAYDPAPPEPGRQSAGSSTTSRGGPRWPSTRAGWSTCWPRASSRRRSSTATTSTRSTSPGRAACCSRSPMTALDSPSTARSRSSAPSSSSRRSSNRTASGSRPPCCRSRTRGR